MAPRIQNFSVPAGNPVTITCDIDPDDGVSLIDVNDIVWKLYEQEHGVPTSADPVITKVLDDGTQVLDPDLLKFTVELTADDTVGLLRNYYHEGHVVDTENNVVTVVYGIMTVTQTENR
jgi:hypothetical protein